MKAKNAPKKKRGRRSEYKEDYVRMAYEACAKLGADDKGLARLFNVSTVTLCSWKNKNEKFLNAIKKGKEEYDCEKVVSALLRRAIGYSHPDVHISSFQGNVTITPITKHYPPDVGAITLYLCNRQPHLWRSVNNTILQQGGQDADKYLKEIADAIKQSDTSAG